MVPAVNSMDNEPLSRPFFLEEIKKALFDLNPSKAPGKDGFTALFYQNAWDTIHQDVSKEVLEVLNNGKTLKDWNLTVVTLIPKSKHPTSIKDFRPINLCNVSYKIKARTITNRFKVILGNIIDPHQSAFIPGRAITDNVILEYECMHWLRHSSNKQGFSALKLDMSKVYDRVE